MTKANKHNYSWNKIDSNSISVQKAADSRVKYTGAKYVVAQAMPPLQQ